jgi:nucleoid-associated protein YgaU
MIKTLNKDAIKSVDVLSSDHEFVLPVEYTVKAGDTLKSIAIALLGDQREEREIMGSIKDLNHPIIKDDEIIYPEQRIYLPPASDAYESGGV